MPRNPGNSAIGMPISDELEDTGLPGGQQRTAPRIWRRQAKRNRGLERNRGGLLDVNAQQVEEVEVRL